MADNAVELSWKKGQATINEETVPFLPGDSRTISAVYPLEQWDPGELESAIQQQVDEAEVNEAGKSQLLELLQ